jgi:hypothetical protein
MRCHAMLLTCCDFGGSHKQAPCKCQLVLGDHTRRKVGREKQSMRLMILSVIGESAESPI